MSLNGIDVSSHNGNINWGNVAETIDFVIIRAGYGKNNIDSKLTKNVKGCQDYIIPFGFYWFSYALNEKMAIAEANYVCDLADKYKPEYPICYDWEYDSDDHAARCNIKITNSLRTQFAEAFLSRVKERGYTPMLYTNIDYLNKGFETVAKKYPVWLAQWGVSKPSKSCDIWQKTSSGKVNGISGNVDLNIGYKEYTDKAKNTTVNKTTELAKIKDKYYKEYYNLAEEIIKGKYGNGVTRKAKIKALGYDYNFAQAIVNILIS